MFDRALSVAVIGHVNAGKTSLIRTLMRDSTLGTVDEAPGTTRAAASVTRKLRNASPLQWIDTPGLSDPVALMELIHALPSPSSGSSTPERLRSFLRRPEAQSEFEPESLALRAMLDADALIYVVDARETVLPKFHCELALMTLLTASAKPVLPVLNQAGSAHARVAAWTAALAEHGFVSMVSLDALTPDIGAEAQLCQQLAELLRTRRPDAFDVAAAAAQEAQERRQRGLKLIAAHLLRLAALRYSLSRNELSDESQRQARMLEVHQQLIGLAQAAQRELLATQGFQALAAPSGARPELEGRWDSDALKPEALKISAGKFGTGAAIGAAVGLGVDVALAGGTLGTGAAAGAAVGAALGGAANQADAPLGRVVGNLVFGRKDVTIDDLALLAQVAQLLALAQALEGRGHADLSPLRPIPTIALGESLEKAVLAAIAVARSHPEWADLEDLTPGQADKRERVLDELAKQLATGAA